MLRFRRPSGLLLILLAFLTVPFAAAAWEEPSPDAEAREREAFPSRPPSALAAPSTSSRAVWTPRPSWIAACPAARPPVRASIRVLTGRLNV